MRTCWGGGAPMKNACPKKQEFLDKWYACSDACWTCIWTASRRAIFESACVSRVQLLQPVVRLGLLRDLFTTGSRAACYRYLGLGFLLLRTWGLALRYLCLNKPAGDIGMVVLLKYFNLTIIAKHTSALHRYRTVVLRGTTAPLLLRC